MKYTVLWSPGAEGDLAEIWMKTRNRSKVTTAARDIDLRLQTDPEHEGESRSRDLRILLAAPLGVIFIVEPDDRRVRIVEVWQFEQRSAE
jgi:plasmid stabilization system protein ParE